MTWASGAGRVLTVGHSNHEWPRFLELLRGAGVTAVADVRSAPFSRRFPHFNRDGVRERLRGAGIAYVYLGMELGGRSGGAGRGKDGGGFESGLRRILNGAERYRVALMCAEHDPADCHRLLIGRALQERGANVGHVLRGGGVQAHEVTERRLLVF